MPGHRPTDYLPSVLHADMVRIAAGRGHPHLTSYFVGAVASAAAVARIWVAAGRPGTLPLPPPLGKADLDDPREIRWTQTLAEEREHQTLINDAGSSRTAVLVAAAQRYVAQGGDLLALMSETPGQLTPWPAPGDELTGLLAGCHPDCPLVSDAVSCWAARLLFAGAQQPTPRADAP